MPALCGASEGLARGAMPIEGFQEYPFVPLLARMGFPMIDLRINDG